MGLLPSKRPPIFSLESSCAQLKHHNISAPVQMCSRFFKQMNQSCYMSFAVFLFTLLLLSCLDNLVKRQGESGLIWKVLWSSLLQNNFPWSYTIFKAVKGVYSFAPSMSWFINCITWRMVYTNCIHNFGLINLSWCYDRIRRLKI